MQKVHFSKTLFDRPKSRKNLTKLITNYEELLAEPDLMRKRSESRGKTDEPLFYFCQIGIPLDLFDR
jgi:hypothetical protein